MTALTIFKIWVKKIWVIFFTKRPYKIKPFKTLFKPNLGLALDVAESTSSILIREQGEIINYSLPPVSLNNKVIYRHINGKKRYLPKGIFKEPDRYVYSIDRGCVIGPWGLCYVAQQRSFIAESSKEWTVDLKYSPYTNIVSFPKKIKLPGITLSCLTNGADGGFYHFLLEAMIKIHQCRSLLGSVDFILFNGPALCWKVNWLNRAGVNIGKIVWVDYKAHYECEQLIFTSRLIDDQQISNWCIDALKSIFKIPSINSSSDTQKMIWLSRKGMRERDIVWEDKILSFFPKIQFIDLGMLNADETIRLLQQTTHIIAPHGAGLSNIYLCRPGTKVLEIFPNGVSFQPYYHRMATICELDYTMMYLDFKDHQNNNTGLVSLTKILEKFIS